MLLFILLQRYSRSDDEAGWGTYIIIFLLILFVIAAIRGAGMKKVIHTHWHHMFDTVPFSAQEFYKLVQETMKIWAIAGISFSRAKHAQGGILAPNREYLRIQYREYFFDICTAPFGKGSFVSFWMGETGSTFGDFLINLPIFGKLFTKRAKTFFELDTEVMFKEAVKESVKSSIEALTTPKGLRNLTNAEWQSYNRVYSAESV